MTVEQKQEYLNDYCISKRNKGLCKECLLRNRGWENFFLNEFKCIAIYESCESDLDKAIAIIDGKTPITEGNVISHPSHYCYSEYEPKDVIRAWGLNFNLGSAVKYISRAGRKDDMVQDLKKAKQFLEFEIEALEKERGNND